MYNGPSGSYRGASGPVQPYAFQNTPHLRQESRTTSAPSMSKGLHKATASTSTTSSDASSSQRSAKDDSVVGSRPASVINLSTQLPDLSFSSAFDSPVKASPDRYRRPAQKRVDSSNAAPKATSPQIGTGSPFQQHRPVQRQASADDMAMSRHSQSELAKRYRRRSLNLNTIDTQSFADTAPIQLGPGAQRTPSGHGPGVTSTPTTIRPVSFVQTTEGEGLPDFGAGAPQQQAESGRAAERSVESVKPATAAASPPRLDGKVSVPPRGSSEPTKRLVAPSPLARQASDTDSQLASGTASPTKPKTYAAAAQAAVSTPSPAAQQLAAVSDKDLNKGMKSKLRRAFSFGSAQELRRTAGQNTRQNNQAAVQQAQQTKEHHQQSIDDELDAEQQEIARRQEAAGIGAGIYSGQGGFSGSTDNLSISSTASSASMMLRKIGRGAKKSGRSIKGLFRPKSVIGVPAADGPLQVGSSAVVEPSVAQVSMVTVEAERLNVNVNAHPDERSGGGTGFPKLERNSMDAASAVAPPEARGSADGSDSVSRRSVVGSDKDRAEVLAAVKKGILKRSGTGSPVGSPVIKPNDPSPGQVLQFTESPASSMPSTPKDVSQRRSSSAPNVNGDYFGTRIALAKSMPNTPNGSIRSISFSPRIQFHDAWSASDYDRRGEIATCNRLTPMLAQQIKEELNTFKMVCRFLVTWLVFRGSEG